MDYLKVKNWDEFQHYKNRTPPWIKLHRDLLRDYDFTCLQDASKLHLVLLWLLASQLDNKIPTDPKWITKQLGLSKTVNLKPLIDNGFILLVQDASKVLADCKQSAIVETETEAYKEEAEAETASRRKRLPKTWQLTEKLRTYCQTKRPDIDPEDTAEGFINFWLGDGRSFPDFVLGDCIEKITGREYPLSATFGKTKIYPEIIQIIYLPEVQRQKLITRDLRYAEVVL